MSSFPLAASIWSLQPLDYDVLCFGFLCVSLLEVHFIKLMTFLMDVFI